MLAKNSKLEFHPLTPERWRDFETLFGERGACGGCWCMWWRITRSQYEERKGARNKRAMKKLVDGGHMPGIIAYQNGQPIGWCSVAPRESFSRLESSRGLKPVDQQPVWSVVCFFVAKEHRHNGLSVNLLKAAIDFVRDRGGRIVEGYPVDAKKKQADAFVWLGLASAFIKAGFKEVERRSETRPIMRYDIKSGKNVQPR
ncbi:MAG TPA: GNAT family N-acetyltransferase [Blastocatellia bacterium]|nr:GNAT family N-acetyltransferase [Blastocatellia bacterium]